MNAHHRKKRAPLSLVRPTHANNRHRPARIPKAPERAPLSSITIKKGARPVAKNGARSGSRPRSALRRPSPGRATNADARARPPDDADPRARAHKAEAYEATVRLAAQERCLADLRGELQEVREFQALEREGERAAEGVRERKGREDAELIEALAQELETAERELEGARAAALDTLAGERAWWEGTRAELQERVERHQREVSAARRDAQAATQSIQAKWERRLAEVEDVVKRQRSELGEAKRDTMAGLAIMKDLDAALRAARAERDDARTQLAARRPDAEQFSEQTAAKKELETALEFVQHERDEARAELGSLREEVHALRPKCEILEQSNEELQEGLAEVEARARERLEALERDATDARARERCLRSEGAAAARDADAARGELTDACEAQRQELLVKAGALEELEARMDALRAEGGRAVDGLEARRERELRTKDDMLEAQDARHDELRADVAALEAERDALADRLQQGQERDAQTADQEQEAAEGEGSATLKADYAAAVKENVEKSRGIRALEGEVRAQRSHLKTMAQQITKTERTSQEVAQLRVEVSSLEATVAALEPERTARAEEAARAGALERELSRARHDGEGAQAKILDLEDALRSMEAALRRVSGQHLPRPGPTGDKERRRRVEDAALREYCAQRLQNCE